MPIYEYVCTECGHELEALQKISDDPLSNCPACTRSGLKKKISAPGFRLSGSGWYETDFKSDKQRNLAKGDSADKDSGDKTEKSSAKPKDKPESSTKASAGATGKEAAA